MAETKHATVEVAHCGPALCGTLTDSDGIRANPRLLDVKNKDKTQQGRAVKGLRMLYGFTWDGSAWTGGQVYNPDDGGTYKGTITPIDADHLKLRGCIVWPLCKTQVWTRVR